MNGYTENRLLFRIAGDTDENTDVMGCSMLSPFTAW